MSRLFGMFNPLFPYIFDLHDIASGFLLRYASFARRVLLIFAHLSLLGILFPEFRREFGSLAGNLLIVILFLSPLAKITRMRLLMQILGFRRELGILMAYLAIVHTSGYFLDPLFFRSFLMPYLGIDLFGMDPRLLFGIAGISLTLPLLVTSNQFATRLLGGIWWKRLHMLAYPMFVAVVLHRFLSTGMDLTETIFRGVEAGVLLGSYGFLKYMAWKKESFPFIRDIINFIAGKYRASSLVKNESS